MDDFLRVCNTCGIGARMEEELDHFVKKKDAKYGRKNKCKQCASIEHKEKWSKNYEKKRVRPDGYKEFRKENAYAWYLKCERKIEINDFHSLLKNADYKCEICNRDESEVYKLVLDHDHNTGDIRGILCHSCNSNLGYFEDDLKNGIFKPTISKTFNVEKAFKYINKKGV